MTELLGMGGHQSARASTDDWLTPPEILAALGPFDVDPCASCSQAHDDATMPKCAPISICRCAGGLAYRWRGHVWLNPPYGDAIGAWVAALAKHGDGIALVFARTDAGWFQDCVFKTAARLFFPAGRLTFYRPDGTRAKFNGGAPSVFVAYGDWAARQLGNLQMRGQLVDLIPGGYGT